MNLLAVGKDEKGVTLAVRLYGVHLLDEDTNELLGVDSLELFIKREGPSWPWTPFGTKRLPIALPLGKLKMTCVLTGFSRVVKIDSDTPVEGDNDGSIY